MVIIQSLNGLIIRPYAGSIEAACSFGSKVEEKDVKGVSVDEENLLVTTPAFMYGAASASEIFEGIGAMVVKVE